MQKGPSWKANRFSSSQIPSILRDPEFHLRVHKTTSLSYREPDQSNLHPGSYFLKIHFNIILPLRLGLPSSPFPSGFSNKTLYVPSLSPPFVLHVPYILFFSILSPEYYFVRCAYHDASVTTQNKCKLTPMPCVEIPVPENRKPSGYCNRQ